MLPWLGGGGAVPRAPGNPASSPSSYSILKRERGKLGGNCGISGVRAGEGWGGGREARRGTACRWEQDADCPCLLQRPGVSAEEREEGGVGGGRPSIALGQHVHCLGPWGFPGTPSMCVFSLGLHSRPWGLL